MEYIREYLMKTLKEYPIYLGAFLSLVVTSEAKNKAKAKKFTSLKKMRSSNFNVFLVSSRKNNMLIK